MALTTPILSAIIPFDATKAYDFVFNVIGGDQFVKTNLVIVRNSDSVEVYNVTIDNFQQKQTLPLNTLTNNVQYKAHIRTCDINAIYSNFSDWVLFYCYAPAVVAITSPSSGIANNQNYLFQGTYTQINDPIKSYIWILYDENGVQLSISPLTYSTTIQYTFTLRNQIRYKIELKTYSQSGVTVSTGLILFLATYIAPTLGAELVLTNLSDQGAVDISIIAIDRVGTGSGYVFEGSDWVNLKGVNAIVKFSDGLNAITNNYSLRLYFKDIPTNTTFLKILSSYGDIQVKYFNNRFHVYQTACGLLGHFISSTNITILSTDKVCLELKIINGLIDVFAQKYV